MASKVKFFCFLASNSVGEDDGSRGTRDDFTSQSISSEVLPYRTSPTSNVAMGLLAILEGWKWRAAIQTTGGWDKERATGTIARDANRVDRNSDMVEMR